MVELTALQQGADLVYSRIKRNGITGREGDKKGARNK